MFQLFIVELANDFIQSTEGNHVTTFVFHNTIRDNVKSQNVRIFEQEMCFRETSGRLPNANSFSFLEGLEFPVSNPNKYS